MNIVKATAAHLPQLVPLFDSYRQFYQQPSDPAGATAFLRQRLTDNESVVFLALDDSIPLGFAQLYPSFSSVSMKRLWILNDLYVSVRARKQGVATALIKQCAILGGETSAKGLVLETASDNLPAQHLYEKLGWTKERAFDRYFIDFSQ